MKKLVLFLMLLIILGLAGAGVFLATWDIPAPAATVEKVIPDERFRR